MPRPDARGVDAGGHGPRADHAAACGRAAVRGPAWPLFAALSPVYTDLLLYRSVGSSRSSPPGCCTRMFLFFAFGAADGAGRRANMSWRTGCARRSGRCRWSSRTSSATASRSSRSDRAARHRRLRAARHARRRRPRRRSGRPGCCGATGSRSASRTRSSTRTSRYYTFTYPFQRFVLGFLFTRVVLSLLVARWSRTTCSAADPAADAGGEGHAGRPGAPVGAARPLRAAEGGRPTASTGTGWCSPTRGWSPAPSYTDVHAVLPAKTILHVHRADLRRAVLRQHLPARLDAAGARRSRCWCCPRS